VDLNGVLAASGSEYFGRPFVGGEDDDGVSASPINSRCCWIAQTRVSNWAMPPTPDVVVLGIHHAWYLERCPKDMHGVVLCQIKKGLPSFGFVSMKLLDVADQTRRSSMSSYVALRLSCHPSLPAQPCLERSQGAFSTIFAFRPAPPRHDVGHLVCAHWG